MKGVQKTRYGSFRVAIKEGGKVRHLGPFKTEAEAEIIAAEALKRRAAGLPLVAPVEYGPLTEKDMLASKFDYDGETGLFTHRRVPNGVRAGQIAGSVGSHGYVFLVCGKKLYLAHRVAWLLTHGRWPPELIDHINGIKTDNRLANLREATKAQNGQNSKPRDNHSNFKGVVLRDKAYKRKKKFSARIKVNGSSVLVGHFESAEDAHAAYVEAAKIHFGEFAYAP